VGRINIDGRVERGEKEGGAGKDAISTSAQIYDSTCSPPFLFFLSFLFSLSRQLARHENLVAVCLLIMALLCLGGRGGREGGREGGIEGGRERGRMSGRRRGQRRKKEAGSGWEWKGGRRG